MPGTADPSLLPAGLLKKLGKAPGKPETTTLAGVDAYRYDTLKPRGGGDPLRVYAVLTTGGVATVACAAEAAACDGIAKTLELRSVDALAVGPTKDYGNALDKTFRTLDKQVAGLARRQRTADTVKEQVAVVQGFAKAYRTAGAAIAKADEQPGGQRHQRPARRRLHRGRPGVRQARQGAARQ